MTEIDGTAANSVCQSIIAVAFSELDYVSHYLRNNLTIYLAIRRLMSGKNVLPYQQPINGDLLFNVTRFVLFFVPKIVSPEGFSPSFVSLLLSLTAVRPRVISLHTFEFWIALEDSDPGARHAYFQQEVFRLLSRVMLSQLLHPSEKTGDRESPSGWGVGVGGGGGGGDSESESESEDEDADDLVEFRRDDQVREEDITAPPPDLFIPCLVVKCQMLPTCHSLISWGVVCICVVLCRVLKMSSSSALTPLDPKPFPSS